MLMLPIETPGHIADALVVILDDANIERMRAADPAEVPLRKSGFNLVNPTVLVCHEKPTPELTRLLNSKDVSAIISYLQRGWKFRPEKGDHDRGPERFGSLQ